MKNLSIFIAFLCSFFLFVLVSQATVVVDIDFEDHTDTVVQARIKQDVYQILIHETAPKSLELRSLWGMDPDQELGRNYKEQLKNISNIIQKAHPTLNFKINMIPTTLWDLCAIKNSLNNPALDHNFRKLRKNGSSAAIDLYFAISKDITLSLYAYDIENADTQLLTKQFLEPIYQMFHQEEDFQKFRAFSQHSMRYKINSWPTYIEQQRVKSEWEKKRKEIEHMYSSSNDSELSSDTSEINDRYEFKKLDREFRALNDKLKEEDKRWVRRDCNLTFTILEGFFTEYEQLQKGEDSLLSKCTDIELQAIKNNQVAFFRATPRFEIKISDQDVLTVLDRPFWLSQGVPVFDQTPSISVASSVLSGALRDNSGLSACTYQFYRHSPQWRPVYALLINRKDLYRGKYSQFFHLPMAEAGENGRPLKICEGILSNGEMFHPRIRGLQGSPSVEEGVKKELEEQRKFTREQVSELTRGGHEYFDAKCVSGYTPSDYKLKSTRDKIKDYGLVVNEILASAIILTNGEAVVSDSDPIQAKSRVAHEALEKIVQNL